MHRVPNAALLLLLASPALAQTVFEVASVKLSREPEGSSTWDTSPAGSLRMRNQSLRDLIRIAYAVKDNQILGGPKWLGSDRYHIDAKAAGPAKDTEVMTMLRALLAERFKLTLHREAKVFPVYALVVAKPGLKIKPVEAGSSSKLNGRRGHLLAEGVSFAKLAQMLSSMVGDPVTDETGIPAVFNFTLDWVPDSAADIPGATIFTALQDQLGLRLDPRKTLSEVLVIDSAEKAEEN